MKQISTILFLLVFFSGTCTLSAQTVLYNKNHKIDSVDWLFFKDFQNVNAGTILFADFENKSQSAKYENKYQFGAFRFDLEGELKQVKLIPDITHNFVSSIVSMGAEYLCLTNQPYQYGLLDGYSKFKIGSFRMDDFLNIKEIKRYPDTTYLPQMFFSPSSDFKKYFYGDINNIYGYYSGYKTNILHEIITDVSSGKVQENKVFDLNNVKAEIVKSYIPDRFLNDVFWMETGAIEHNGEIFLVGYFVSFKSDGEYSAQPLNLICKINKERTKLTYKILDYSTSTFNFFLKDDDGNFFTFRGADEIIKFNYNLDFLFQKKLSSDNPSFNIYSVYFYEKSLFWSGSVLKSNGVKPLVIKTDLNGNKIWEVVLDGNIAYGIPPVIVQKTPALYLVFSGQGNDVYVSEIQDNSVGVYNEGMIESSITPNPASDYINVDLSFPGMQESEIEIYNFYGQCLMTVETTHELSLQRIDISTLTSGIYFVKVGNEKLMKFVKM